MRSNLFQDPSDLVDYVKIPRYRKDSNRINDEYTAVNGFVYKKALVRMKKRKSLSSFYLILLKKGMQLGHVIDVQIFVEQVGSMAITMFPKNRPDKIKEFADNFVRKSKISFTRLNESKYVFNGYHALFYGFYLAKFDTEDSLHFKYVLAKAISKILVKYGGESLDRAFKVC